MDNILAQQLLALGQDAHLRRQNLLNLVPCLTQQEVRDLTARLAEVDFRTDIVSRLPPELRLNVIRQLGDFDVFPLLNVSRQWRAIWLQPHMLTILSQQCRYLDTNLPRDGDVIEPHPDGWTDLQYELVRRRRCRFLGRFSSAIVVRHNVGDGHNWLNRGLKLAGVFPPTPVGEFYAGGVFSRAEAPPLEHRSFRSSLYAVGRLAWLPESLPAPDNALIVVEDLYSKTKKIYRNTTISQYGGDMALKALGDRLLIAGTSRVMFIWHLESNQCSQVFLPQQPSCCVSRGEYVAFIQRDSALLWKSGSELTALDIEPVLASNKSISSEWSKIISSNTLGIFFHPFEEETLFISVCFTQIRLVVVHRFTAAGYSGAHEINLRDIPGISHLSLDERADFSLGGGTVSCRAIPPVNSSGDFLVAEWRTFSSGKRFEQGAHVSATTFIELRFNVRTGGFALIEKSLPSGTWDEVDALDLGTSALLPSWNDQMALALQVEQNSRPAWAQKPCWNPALVVMPVCPRVTTDTNARIHSVRPGSSPDLQTALSYTPRPVTVKAHLHENKLDLSPATSLKLVTEENRPYTLKPELHGSNASTHTLKALFSKSDFVLDLPPTFKFPGNGGRIEGPHHIFQDDDFIILFHRHGYIAWDFRAEAADT